MSANDDGLRPTYSSVDDLARELGISRQKAYTELRTGRIPSIRLGRRWIIPRSAIEVWLRSAGRSASSSRIGSEKVR